MKRNKIFFLITLILISCTGCTVEYNINITNNSIEENIKVEDRVMSNRIKSDILKHYNMWYPVYVNFIPQGESIEIEDFSEKVDGIEYYEKSIKEVTNGYSYTYNYKHSIDNYYDSYILASTYQDTTIYNGYNSLVLKTSENNFLCDYDYFEKVKINVTIDPSIYKLNYTNTSNISNNTYTWILDRDNCNNSQIILTLDKINNSNIDPNNEIQKEESKEYLLYIFCGILIILILIGYLIFKKIKNRSEKFDIDD